MISIVITTYNKLPYLKATLSFLENQSKQDDFEVVLIVDGSTDGTIEFLKNTKFSYSLKYYVIKQGGLANARNHGIKKSNGNHILFMDDDLRLSPDYIAKLSESLDHHPNHVHTGVLKKININSVENIFKIIENTDFISTELL